MAVAVLISPMQHSWTSLSLGREADSSYPTELQYSYYNEQEKDVDEPAPRFVDKSTENESTVLSAEEQAELRKKILRQVEWYFGDENLLKDSFLMKHINRNKQGYVSLKLVSSLRKVKAITKDWTIVQESVRTSSLLQLNEDGTKIRRLAPVPQIDYSRLPKTIIITNYPSEDPSVDQVQKEFSRHGEVAVVQFLQPGKAIPLDVKSCRTQHPAIGKEPCILVQYKSAEAAKQAVYMNSSSENWRQTMTVKLLVEPEINQDRESERQCKKEIGKKQKSQEKADKPKPKRSGVDKESHSKQTSKPRHGGKHHVSLPDYSSDSGYSGRSASNSPVPSPKLTRKNYSEHRHTVVQTTPLSKLAGEAVRPVLHIQKPMKDASVVVIRQPYGPDGSRGFHHTR